MKRIALAALIAATALPATAATFSVSVEGGDSIWLAGRTDLAIPPANQSWGDNNSASEDGMRRHTNPTPEEVLETPPETLAITAGQTLRVLDPADGGINFFNGFGPSFFGPDGNGVPGSSSISAFGSISGYIGTQGALVGVFLTDAIPTGAPPPSTLDFSLAGLGVEFLSLSPQIGQVFFIGDGQTGGGTFQEFIAPTGATRVALGLTDAFGFNGVPGAFDDNDGAYRIRVGIDEIPTDNPVVPLPASVFLLLGSLGGLAALKRRG